MDDIHCQRQGGEEEVKPIVDALLCRAAHAKPQSFQPIVIVVPRLVPARTLERSD